MRLSKQGFVAWLRSKKPGDNVGVATSHTQCPLAYYLSDAMQETCVIVEEYWEDSNENRHNNPNWARGFIDKVDGRSGTITASRALKLLGEQP